MYTSGSMLRSAEHAAEFPSLAEATKQPQAPKHSKKEHGNPKTAKSGPRTALLEENANHSPERESPMYSSSSMPPSTENAAEFPSLAEGAKQPQAPKHSKKEHRNPNTAKSGPRTALLEENANHSPEGESPMYSSSSMPPSTENAAEFPSLAEGAKQPQAPKHSKKEHRNPNTAKSGPRTALLEENANHSPEGESPMYSSSSMPPSTENAAEFPSLAEGAKQPQAPKHSKKEHRNPKTAKSGPRTALLEENANHSPEGESPMYSSSSMPPSTENAAGFPSLAEGAKQPQAPKHSKKEHRNPKTAKSGPRTALLEENANHSPEGESPMYSSSSMPPSTENAAEFPSPADGAKQPQAPKHSKKEHRKPKTAKSVPLRALLDDNANHSPGRQADRATSVFQKTYEDPIQV